MKSIVDFNLISPCLDKVEHDHAMSSEYSVHQVVYTVGSGRVGSVMRYVLTMSFVTTQCERGVNEQQHINGYFTCGVWAIA